MSLLATWRFVGSRRIVFHVRPLVDLHMDWGEEENDIVLGMHYAGLLDDLAVFNRALTREEVEALYTLEQGAAELHENDSE